MIATGSPIGLFLALTYTLQPAIGGIDLNADAASNIIVLSGADTNNTLSSDSRANTLSADSSGITLNSDSDSATMTNEVT